MGVSATSRAFGNVQVGQSSTSVAHTVSNNGNIAATSLSIGAPTGYSITGNTCSTSLAAGGSCSFAITFSPSAAQAYNGNVSVATANGGSPTVAVTGTGVAQSATITDIAFGNQASGNTPTSSATLTNTGIGPLSVTVPGAGSVSGTGFSFVSTTCGSSVPASGSCTVTVRYTASGTAAASGSLTVATGAGNKVSSLSGQSQAAALDIVGTSLAFGNVTVGNTAVSATQTLTNSGNIAATGVQISSPFASYFIGANTCGSTLAAGASCTFTVSFTPQAAQAYNGNVTATSSNAGSDTLAVTGTGTQSLQLEVQTVPPAGKEALCGTSSAYQVHNFTSDVGGQSWNCTPTTWNLRLTNKTASTMTIGSFARQGTTWTIASNGCNSTLAAGASCVVAIKSPTYTAKNSSGTYVSWSTVGINKYVYIY